MKGLFRNSKFTFVLGILVACGIMLCFGEQPNQPGEEISGPSVTVPDYQNAPDKTADFVHSFPVGTVVRYDLNGDGIGEDITVNTHEYEAGNVTVGNSTVEIWSAAPTGYFTVLKPDASRNVLLVGVSDYGPSDDFQTVLYAYDGRQIKEVGYFNDILGRNVYEYTGAICNGDGTVTAKRRWDVLGSWNTVGRYAVSESGVADITEFYPYIDWDGNLSTWKVTAKTDIIMYETSQFDNLVTVPAGTVMDMIGLQRGPHEEAFWVAFDVEGWGKLWVIVERIEWESFLHTGLGFVSSDQAFDGFYYAG